ncbi:MAG: hypothetical protein ACOC56_00190 [Atribacterota bacterium]
MKYSELSKIVESGFDLGSKTIIYNTYIKPCPICKRNGWPGIMLLTYTFIDYRKLGIEYNIPFFEKKEWSIVCDFCGHTEITDCNGNPLFHNTKENKILIGLYGQSRAGKDTTADILVREYNFKKFSFAKKGKDILKNVFGFTEEQLETDLKEKIDERYGKTPRFAMQHLINAFRDFYSDVWVDYVEKQIKDVDLAVISDVRMSNEAEMVKRNGGLLIKIERPSLKSIENPHETDVGMKNEKPYITLVNDGTIKDLELEVKMLFY